MRLVQYRIYEAAVRGRDAEYMRCVASSADSSMDGPGLRSTQRITSIRLTTMALLLLRRMSSLPLYPAGRRFTVSIRLRMSPAAENGVYFNRF